MCLVNDKHIEYIRNRIIRETCINRMLSYTLAHDEKVVIPCEEQMLIPLWNLNRVWNVINDRVIYNCKMNTVWAVHIKIVPVYNSRRSIACACKFIWLVNVSPRGSSAGLRQPRELSRNVLSNFELSSHGYRGRDVSFYRFSTLVKI